jgi:hypothetical protein
MLLLGSGEGPERNINEPMRPAELPRAYSSVTLMTKTFLYLDVVFNYHSYQSSQSIGRVLI